MLCFFSVAEAHGLLYPRPSDENFSFAHLELFARDGRSISPNVANINKLVQDKTVLSEHSTTNSNIPVKFGWDSRGENNTVL